MTSDQISDGRFVWQCDGCSTRMELDGELWSCWRLLKSKGWVAYNMAGPGDQADWRHECGKCQRNVVRANDLMSRVPFKPRSV